MKRTILFDENLREKSDVLLQDKGKIYGRYKSIRAESYSG